MTSANDKPLETPGQKGLTLEKNKIGRPKKDRDDPFRAGLRGDLVPVNFQWDRETVQELDKASGELGLTRSQLIRQVLTNWLTNR